MPALSYFIAFPVNSTYMPGYLGYANPILLEPLDLLDLHITIAFFGVTSEEVAWQAWSCLQPIGVSRIECIPKKWQLMGPPNNPNSYALVLDSAHNMLHDTISIWRRSTEIFLHKGEYDYPLVPHLTMYRYKRQSTSCSDHKTLLDRYAFISSPQLTAFPVEEVALYRSKRGLHVGRYEIVERRRLS
jgi:2'-5' RNA ligase